MAEHIRQAEVGSCAFLDVLEEAVLRATPVTLVLGDGRSFEDVVCDVVTRDGKDLVVLGAHDPLDAREIVEMTRATISAAPRR